VSVHGGQLDVAQWKTSDAPPFGNGKIWIFKFSTTAVH